MAETYFVFAALKVKQAGISFQLLQLFHNLLDLPERPMTEDLTGSKSTAGQGRCLKRNSHKSDHGSIKFNYPASNSSPECISRKGLSFLSLHLISALRSETLHNLLWTMKKFQESYTLEFSLVF